MANIDDYNKLLETIKLIPKDQIKNLNKIPIDVYIQEAENLYHWCQKDKEQLIATGLDVKLIDELPIRCGALREAESRWITTRFSRKKALKKWIEESPKAYDLRNELLHHFRFAYRENSDLIGRVGVIAEGASHADMLQDLNDLNVLGKNNPDQLNQIKFDMSLLDQATQLADELSDLPGQSTTERSDYQETKQIRDHAYTYLKHAVDVICEYGQYLFWRDDERKKGYASHYLRKKRRKKSGVYKEGV